MKKFWNWMHDDDSGGRILRLEGPIDDEQFWGDEITPRMFREDLESEDGDVTVWINSPGGNVFAAAEIYTMLRDYRGSVTVKIASIAASAASVIAMAGDTVRMSPTALLMIHDPSTIAMGNTKDMERAIDTLNEVKESILNAYAAKTGLRRSRIAELMSNETWMNARKALELGFCDEILYEDGKGDTDASDGPGDTATDTNPTDAADTAATGESGKAGNRAATAMKSGADTAASATMPVLFSTRQMDAAILNRLKGPVPEAEKPPDTPVPMIGMDGKTMDGAMPYAILRNQLDFLR